MGVIAVPSHEFVAIKDQCEWHFQSFADRSYGETTVEDLHRAIMDATKQCWVYWDDGIKAVALTQVLNNPLETVEMTHCAGVDREEWQDEMVDTIREWAIDRGSRRFRIVNRPGWTRFLKGKGLKETHRILEQDLE